MAQARVARFQLTPARRRKRLLKSLLKNIWDSRYMYLLLVPGLLFFAFFRYVPMYGIQLAWK